MNNETRLLVIFVGLIAFALLMQAIVMLVAFLVMRKKVKSLQEDVQELRTTAIPILNKSRETLENRAMAFDVAAMLPAHAPAGK